MSRGFVLPFIALMIVALLSMIALAIDLGLWSAALNRAQTTTDRAALSAIEIWMREQGVASDLTELQNNVGARLEGILNVNRSIGSASTTGQWYEWTPQPEEFGIIPGRYVTTQREFAAAQNGGLNCGVATFNEPVFCGIPSQPSGQAPTALGVNAIRIVGQTYEPILSVFSRILGYRLFPLNVESTAINIPPELYFVVDISGSTVGENHLRQDDTNTPIDERSEFVFMLHEDETTIRPPATQNLHNRIWGRMEVDRGGSTVTLSSKHFQSDYDQVLTVLDNIGQSIDITPPLHRVTGGNDPIDAAYSNIQYRGGLRTRTIGPNSANYRGPEPLTTILGALETLINRIGELNMAGNRVGVLFFDGPRIVPAPWAPSVFIPDATLNFQQRGPFGWSRIFRSMTFDELNSVFLEQSPNTNPFIGGIVNGMLPNIHRDDLVRYGIFPSLNNFTDVNHGLMQAVFELLRTREAGIRTAQRIILITDGIANCGRDDLLTYFFGMNTQWGPSNEWQILTDNLQCQNSLPYYLWSMQDSVEIAQVLAGSSGAVARGLPPALNIPIDVILMGEDVDPNLLDVREGGTCITDQDVLRRRRLPITDGFTPGCDNPNNLWNNGACALAFLDRTATKPFRRPNIDWMTVAWMSGGNFYPIRRENTPSQCWGVAGTPAEQYEEIIDQLLGSSQSFRLVN